MGSTTDNTPHTRSEPKGLELLNFFESMDKINRVIQGASDIERMMSDVLDAVLAIFDCDRAYLLYPCDPDAETWTIPMERTKPQYPGLLEIGLTMPMRPEVADIFRILLASHGPVKFGPGMAHPLVAEVAEQFNFKCFMAMALYPKVGRPWEFGMQQCAYLRSWKPEEERLMQEVGRRLGDGLTSLLAFHDLRKSEAFLNNIVENIPNMIFVKDARTLRYVRMNKAGEQLLGISRQELLGKGDDDFFPEEADFFNTTDRRVLEARKLLNIPEELIRTRNNDERILHTKKIPILDESGAAQFLLGISEDITERKKLEAQLRQAQRMEAVGQLAGGVAHDFNNMLGVIIGHTELLLDQVGPSHPLLASLREIHTAALRSSDLTRQLLAFARKQTIAPKVLDLNETVEGMLKMLRRLIGEDMELCWRPGTRVWPVKVDPSQIDQVLANLCVNARDAIAGVGRITIGTDNAAFDEAYCALHPGFAVGQYVQLIVSDNGCGMDQATLEKIFEPFFTTKQIGRGTGLGLATVYGIVKQNNGFINVYSEPGYGTTFNICLPRYAEEAGQKPGKREPAPAAHGDETILIVEDEPSILKMGQLILEKFGYRVLVAAGPGDAIRAAGKHAGPIHLLITDVVMPEMNGRELAQRLAALYPEVKCLFMSGYTGDVIAHHEVLDEGVHFIQKPFSMQALAAKVRAVLDSVDAALPLRHPPGDSC